MMVELEEHYYEDQFSTICQFLRDIDIKYLNNNGDCGTGKTTLTIHEMYYDMDMNPTHKYVIAVPLKKIIDKTIRAECDEVFRESNRDIRVVQIYSKHDVAQNFSESRCYIKGCSECPHKPICNYINQDWDASIIITTYELVGAIMKFVNTYNRDTWYGLIIEEEPTRLWYSNTDITKWNKYYTKTNPTEITSWNNFKYDIYDVKFVDEELIPNNLECYKLRRIIQYNENFKIQHFKGTDYLFCNKKQLIPKYFKKIILNCATTPSEFRDIMFKFEYWNTCGVKIRLGNPMFAIGHQWGKTSIETKVNDCVKFVKYFIDKGLKVFVITKLSVEDNFKAIGADTVHYGDSRGFNENSKDYDLVIVYGSYLIPPQELAKYKVLGLKEDLVHELEQAEIIQSFNRFRPVLRQDVPIIFCTQELSRYYKEMECVPNGVLKYFANNPVSSVLDIEQKTDGIYKDYRGYKRLVSWLEKWLFSKTALHYTQNQLIIHCRLELKSIKQTAKRCKCSISKVKRIFKKFKTKYGDQLGCRTNLFEVEL